VFFVLFAYMVISGTSNAVNSPTGWTAAAGSSAMVFAAYTVISSTSFPQKCPVVRGRCRALGCFYAFPTTFLTTTRFFFCLLFLIACFFLFCFMAIFLFLLACLLLLLFCYQSVTGLETVALA